MNNPNNDILLDRFQIKHCYAPNSVQGAGYLSNDGGSLTLRNTVVADGQALINGGLEIYTSAAGITYLSHLSITGATSTGPSSSISGLHIFVNDANSLTFLSNSVVWGNDPDAGVNDIELYGSNTFLSNVHYGTLNGMPAANTAPGTGDPGFQGANDPQLSGSSVLIDSGIANPLGGAGTLDVDGKPRVNGVAPDVGAYEVDYLFRANFELGS